MLLCVCVCVFDNKRMCRQTGNVTNVLAVNGFKLSIACILTDRQTADHSIAACTQ